MAMLRMRVDAIASSDAQTLHRLLAERVAQNRMELPLLPAAAAEALSACRSDDVSPQEVADLLHRDPGIASHVLRLANSAVYGMSNITSLTQAIHRLGYNGVAEVILVVAVHGRLFRNPRYVGLMSHLWRHSAVAGSWAREIARHTRQNVEAGFLCGLLHDIGAPVLYHAISEVEGETGCIWTPEDAAAVIDPMTPETGARLMDLWGLPAWAAAAVRQRPNWNEAVEHETMTQITALADLMATWSLDSDEGPGDRLPLALLTLLELYPDDVEQLVARRDLVHSAAEDLQS